MKQRVIKTEDQYEKALARIEELFDAIPGSQEEEELELLAILVEKYEDIHYPIGLPGPIEGIKFRMDQQNLTQKDMVKYIGSLSKVSEVLNGKRPLSLSMIRSLHEGLGIPYEVLLHEEGKQLEACKYNIRDYPFTEMFKRDYFPSFTGNLSRAKDHSEELLTDFFSEFEKVENGLIYNRKSLQNSDETALKAWQARVLNIAAQQEISSYKHEKINFDFLVKAGKLSFYESGPRVAIDLLNKFGIHFIILPHLPKTHLDGACFSSPSGNPVIGMTLRYDRLDNFWFTLMHELAHVSLHLENENAVFFDNTEEVVARCSPNPGSANHEHNPGFGEHRATSDSESKKETEANQLAQKALIPEELYPTQRLTAVRNAKDVKQIAEFLEISPAIVAGRVANETQDFKKYSSLLGWREVRKVFATF